MTELTYPDGSVFGIDFADVGHAYNVCVKTKDGSWTQPVPTHGVTTPLSKTVDKPFIAPWVAKISVHEVLAWCYNNPSRLAEVPQMFADLERMEAKDKSMTYYKFTKTYPWLKNLKATYKNSAQEGRDDGDWFHHTVQKFLNDGTNPTTDPKTALMWKSFIEFYNFYKPKTDSTEFLVYSRTWGYSGAGDWRGEINGKYVILDWKTTNRSDSNKDGISFDNFYQLGGLAQAEYERTGKWVDDVGIVNIDKEGGEAVIIMGSDWGMSPEECAKRYITHLAAYKQQVSDDYKFGKRNV